MKIAVDAMGGDFGPRVTVEGAVRAAEEYDVDVVLVGVERSSSRKSSTSSALPGAASPSSTPPRPSAWATGSCPSGRSSSPPSASGPSSSRTATPAPSSPWGTRRPWSISPRRPSGALKGVDKPALALLLPNLNGVTLLVDVGANANCQPHHLVQFAVMGKIFMETALGMPNRASA